MKPHWSVAQSHLGELERAVDAACRGLGHCVFVMGEAGIGKSRLVAEAALATHAVTTVLQARAYESERALPFGLWVDALRSVSASLEIASGLDPAWRSQLARLLPEVAPRKVTTYGTSADERRLFDSVLYLLLHLSERAPVVIVLEDLHWTDEASARLLAFLARRIASARVLIIATVREEDIVQGSTLRDDFSELVLSSSASKVELRGLSQAHTFELIRRLAYSKTER
jgi:predicted ATPase